MTTYRPIDSKREEFRKYLERAGVMDALTKALVLLYEEPDKPEDALDFIRTSLGDKRPNAAEIDAMRFELQEAQNRVKELEREIAILKGEELPDENEDEAKAFDEAPSEVKP
ncbi:c-Myc-binding protein isoform X1 [Cimex lectularius]|uniref:c-Myc-binding protein n=1 Tax=Cimex lectularius TaxID=79782 RepID=A0A8I6RVS4_CIMLE|nr:c-Myc-binding protein isoform X1 [Cimex lectularius]